MKIQHLYFLQVDKGVLDLRMSVLFPMLFTGGPGKRLSCAIQRAGHFDQLFLNF